MKKSYQLIIAGDLLPSGANQSLFKKGDAQAIFGEKVYELFHEADYSILNLEGPLTDSSEGMEKTGPVIKAPADCVHGLKNLGVKALALANNHITDYGRNGFEETVKVLAENGIDYLGAGEQGKIKKSISLLLGSKRVCIYNVSEEFYNAATASTPGANLYDEYVVCNEIKGLKRLHDYLIVIYHGGAEEFAYPTPLLRLRFHRMAECGADFITAQHTHCIGCFEEFQGSYLLYGQGNFLFARMKNKITRQGLITEILFSDSDVQVKQYVVTVSDNDVVRYDENQELSGFYERSKELNNFSLIEEKYKQFAYNKPSIKDRFLAAYRGNSFYCGVLKRIMPRYYKKNVLENYKREQLMRISKTMSSDRYGEDMLAAVSFMLENTKAQL